MPWGGCSGQPTAAHSQNHSFRPFGNGNRRLSPLANLTSFSVALHIYSIASLRKTTIIQPLTPLRAPGGGQVMRVPQTVERHVGLATSQTQESIRYGGSITRSRQTSTLGPSRTASPSVALQLWKCWVHSFSRCTYVRRVRPSGDRCFYPWPVITRTMSTGCWMTGKQKMPTSGLLMEIMFQLTWLHHYFRSSRSSLGYYNILMHKVIFLDRSQSSLPLLLRRERRGGSASTGFGWSYSPRTLSWERYFSLILTLPTCGLRTGDLVGLCQLLALLVRLDFWSTWQGPFWIWPRNLWAHFDTCQQARVAQTGTQTQKEKVLLLLLLGCCLSVSSVGLFSWLADINHHYHYLLSLRFCFVSCSFLKQDFVWFVFHLICAYSVFHCFCLFYDCFFSFLVFIVLVIQFGRFFPF